MENIEKKPTRNEIEQELNLLRSLNKLIDKSNIIRFLWKNIEGWNAEYVSKNVVNIFEYKADDFIKNRISYSDIIHSEDLERVENEVDYFSKQNKEYFEHIPYRIITKSGKIKWIKDTTVIIRNDNNEITHFHGLISDITNNKKNIDKLKKLNIKLTESKEKYKSFFDNNKAIILQVNPISKKIIYANFSAIDFYGFSKKELLSKTVDRLNILSVEEINKKMQKILKKQSSFYEFKHKLANGEIRDVEARISPIKTENGIVLFIIISDITTRKIAELEVIKNNKKLNIILNAFIDGVYICNTEYEIEFLNNSMIKVIGYAVGEKCYKAIYNNNEPCENCNYEKLIKSKKERIEKKINNKYYNVVSVLLENNSKLSFYNDITEIRNSQLILKHRNEILNETILKAIESEEKYKILSNLTFEGILLHDKGGVVLDTNLSFTKIFGYSKKELIGTNVIELLSTEESKKIMAENINKEYAKPYEVEGITKNGLKFPIELEAKIININNKDIRVTAVRDITLRKKAQKEINKLSKAVEQSANTIVITDINGNIEYTNPKFTEITGYTKEEVLGKNQRILKTGFTSNETYKNLWQTITKGKIWNGEIENVTKYGIFFTENITITPIKNENNEIINFLAIKEDITQKKENEKKLIKSRERFKLLSESTFEAIFIIENNIITDVNKAALSLTQYSYNELIGSSPVIFIDEAYRSIAINNLLSDSDAHYESVGIKKDGTKINIKIQGKIIKESNKTYRITAVKDITERIKTNRLVELEKNNSFSKIIEAQEKEKYKLSKLLHDGLGPELSSLRLHFDALKSSNNKTESEKIIRKSFNIIETITEGIRDVSKILSPHLLKDFGLDVAINNYLGSILSKIEIKFTSNIENLRFGNEIEIAIYRIIQELITNTIKHSKAKNINIELTIKKNILLCMYSDNGIGFEINTVMKNSNKGIGLKNIISRVKYIKGNHKIESNNKGFSINIEVPIK